AVAEGMAVKWGLARGGAGGIGGEPLPQPGAGAVEGIVVIGSEPMPSTAERNSSRLRRTGRQAQTAGGALTAPTMPSVATQNRLLSSGIRPVTGVRYARTYSAIRAKLGEGPSNTL